MYLLAWSTEFLLHEVEVPVNFGRRDGPRPRLLMHHDADIGDEIRALTAVLAHLPEIVGLDVRQVGAA